jgi:mono/diheme cytochrome c family protein
MAVFKSVVLATLTVGAIIAGAVTVYSQYDSHGRGSHAGSDHRIGGHGRGMGYGSGMRHGPGHKGNPIRHRIIRHGAGIPSLYLGKKNPLSSTRPTIAAGKKLYSENCASCHGVFGAGDGEAGRELNPKPANLAFLMDKWIATDDFLFWSISEGGAPLKTDMPAFKEQLTEEQRWQITQYLRTAW